MRKGEKMSEEQKQRLSEINKGNKRFAGRQHTEESKAKIAAANMGRVQSPETRQKNSESRKGKGHPHTEESKRKIAEANARRELDPEYKAKMQTIHSSLEYKQKQSEASKGHVCSELSKEKTAARNRAKVWDEEARRKNSEAHLGKVWSEESKRKASETHTGMHHSEETKKKMSDFWAQNLETKERRDALVRELWQNPEFRDRTLRAMVVGRKAGLTFPEKILQALLYVLKDVGGEGWRYAGDGSYPVGGKKPDFINPEAKRIIEVYGDYWHRGDDPQERIDYFAELGYKTLVVWERELLPIKKSSDSFNIAVSDTVHRVWMFLS